MCEHDCGQVARIQLDHGSEASALSVNACVRVYLRDDPHAFRVFTIITHECLVKFNRPWDDYPREDIGVYTTGGPLAIVREISGAYIVMAVLGYLRREGRGGI
jgi:hypothetical protein